MSSENQRDDESRALERQTAARESLVPASYAEKAMSSLLRLHEDLVEEKEKRIDLYRRLMEREQSLAEMRAYVKLLEAELANRGLDASKWALDPMSAPSPGAAGSASVAAAAAAGQAQRPAGAPASSAPTSQPSPAAAAAARAPAASQPAPEAPAAATQPSPAATAPEAPEAATQPGTEAPAASPPPAPEPPAAARQAAADARKAATSGATDRDGGAATWGQPVVAWTPGSSRTTR